MNRKLMCGVLLGGTCLVTPVFAQTAQAPTNFVAPPERNSLDARNVNRIDGTVAFRTTDLQIGPAGPGGLGVSSLNGRAAGTGNAAGSNWEDMYLGVNLAGTVYSASNGFTSETFSRSGNTFTSLQNDGTTLVLSGSTYTLTDREGNKIVYGYAGQASGEIGLVVARATSITYPTGEVNTLTWKGVTYCSAQSTNVVSPSQPSSTGKVTATSQPTGSTASPNATAAACNGSGTYLTRTRLTSVTSSQGYQLHYFYVQDTIPENQTEGTQWQTLTSISAINTTIDYCDPAAVQCTGLTQTPAVAQYNIVYGTGNIRTFSVTDPVGRVTRFNYTGSTFRIQTPISSTYDIVYNYTAGTADLSTVTWRGLTYGYTSNVGTGQKTITSKIQSGDQQQETTVADTNVQQLLSYTDGLGRKTAYTYDAGGNLLSMTPPKQEKVTYLRDVRGNATKTTYTAVSGSGLADIVTSAVYPTNCTYAVNCNKPTSVTDGKGNTTSYTYDNIHGGVLTVTSPAVSVNGTNVQPQTRYTYTALQAYAKNSAGAIVASGVTAYRLTGVSTCQTTASCAGGADEVKTTIVYGTAGVANNLLPTAISKGTGNGSLTATTAITYDAAGNAILVDAPLAGNADTTRYRFDAAHRVVGVIGADPDGAGSKWNPAQRITYNGDNNPTLVEQGTVPSQADANWNGFSNHRQVATSYDGNGRKALDQLQSGGTTYSYVQYSYDGNGRLSCSVQRMNPNAFGGQSDACAVGTVGTFGQDRITQNAYDLANQLTAQTTGYGTGDASTTKMTYNVDGKLQTVTDGKNNRTNQVYDGFVRLSQVQYPDPSKANTSSMTDFEQYGYDANGNVTSRRIRNNTTITYGYDALNRMTSKTLPSGTTNPASAFGYDLVGNLLSANNSGGYANTTSYTWDALGRKTGETSSIDGANSVGKSMQYDLAGNRTRLTWGDGFYVTYEYDNDYQMTAIRENGGTVLASFVYDDDGRRTSRTLANGTSTSYGYDAVSRLTSLSLNGGNAPTAITIPSYNPAGEIMSRTNSNDSYAWTAGANVAGRAYVTNGLNQYATISGSTQSYDPKGNLTGSGGATFSYNAENRLATSGSSTLRYDALGRLVVDLGIATRFDVDGDNMISEHSGAGALLRRFVFGPGTDEPIVWYEGTGTTDKRYMDADERGSIIRITNGSGTQLATNTYDEFGVPGTANGGRFQYTGQAWLADIGLYYYKARVYSPNLGRFMQIDPAGFINGPNLYNYVGGNPVNATDPTGLACVNDLPDCSQGWIATAPSRSGSTGGGWGASVPWSNPAERGDGSGRTGRCGGNGKSLTCNSSAPQNDDIVVNGKRKPAYCGSSIYQAASFVDSAAGKGQYAAVAVAVAGKGEAVAAVGAPLIEAGFAAYDLLGTARALAATAKAAVRLIHGDAPDLSGFVADAVTRYSAIDKAGQIFSGITGDLVLGATIPDPCS